MHTSGRRGRDQLPNKSDFSLYLSLASVADWIGLLNFQEKDGANRT